MKYSSTLRRPLPPLPQQPLLELESPSATGRLSPPPAYSREPEPTIAQQVASSSATQPAKQDDALIRPTTPPPASLLASAPLLGPAPERAVAHTAHMAIDMPPSRRASFDDEAGLIGAPLRSKSSSRRTLLTLGALTVLGAVAAGVVLGLRHGKGGSTSGTTTSSATPAATTTAALMGTSVMASPTPTTSVATSIPTSTSASPIVASSLVPTPSPSPSLWAAGNYQVGYNRQSSTCESFGITCALDSQIWGIAPQSSGYAVSNNVNLNGPWSIAPALGTTAFAFNETLDSWTTGDGCLFARQQAFQLDQLLPQASAPQSGSMVDTFTGFDITCIRPNGIILPPKSSCACSYEVSITPYG